jgi:acetyl esterase/lipase
MAAMLALNDAYLRAAGVPPSAIAGLVGLSGPYVLAPNTESLDDIFASPYTPADWQPARFASRQAPPTLLLHGLDDTVVSPEQTQRLAEALGSYRIAVESELYRKRGHADTIASFALVARFRTPALEQTVSFLDRVSATAIPARASSAAHWRQVAGFAGPTK